jgi:hypothetical protein
MYAAIASFATRVGRVVAASWRKMAATLVIALFLMVATTAVCVVLADPSGRQRGGWDAEHQVSWSWKESWTSREYRVVNDNHGGMHYFPSNPYRKQDTDSPLPLELMSCRDASEANLAHIAQQRDFGLPLKWIGYRRVIFSNRGAIADDHAVSIPWAVWRPAGQRDIVVPYNFHAGPALWNLMGWVAVVGSIGVIRDAYRRHRGLCSRCGYSLAGLVGQRCPECGREAKAT